MRLRNIRELQLRARWHAQLGHIEQGTYGNGEVNGHAEFRGCAVGCLSTPHTKNRLIEFLREHLTPYGGLDNEGQEQREALTDEFGITTELVSTVEAIFEAQPTHGAAIEFVPNFANALTEGAVITDENVAEWLSKHNLAAYEGWNPLYEELEPEGDDYINELTGEFLEFVGSHNAEQEVPV